MRADRAEAKATKLAVKKERKAAKKSAKEAEAARFDAKKAKNAVKVGKVLVPAIIPVLAPLAARAAAVARDAYDRRKARRIGVDVEALGEFQGRGAALNARIAGLSDGISELRAGGTAEGSQFADRCSSTLRQLSSAVKASERMPATRRKAAHRAVSDELDRLETQLLHHLGVS
ncbi:MAG: DUF6474 family protein [Haloechinothrix sp.]